MEEHPRGLLFLAYSQKGVLLSYLSLLWSPFVALLICIEPSHRPQPYGQWSQRQLKVQAEFQEKGWHFETVRGGRTW